MAHDVSQSTDTSTERKLDYDSFTPEQLLTYVQTELEGERTLHAIAQDFVQSNGKPVHQTMIRNRIENALPGYVAKYKPIGRIELYEKKTS